MRLSELADWKKEASVAASEQARRLALAGIAVVWLFAGPLYLGGRGSSADALLQAAAGSFAVSLALDVVQLVVRTIAIEINYQLIDRRAPASEDDPRVDSTPGINVSTSIPFYAKFVALFVGYVCLVVYFGKATF